METDETFLEYTENEEETEQLDTEEDTEEITTEEETEESLEESSEMPGEMAASQEIVVNFDNISLSTNLNDLGLVGVTLLCVVLILSLTLVWGYNKS